MEPLHELGRHRRSEICLLKRAVDTVDSVTRPIPQSNCYEGEDGKYLSQCGVTLRLYGAHQCNPPRRRGTLRMQIEVSASEIKAAKKADDRGRVTLGSEYAGKAVTVAVLEVEDE